MTESQIAAAALLSGGEADFYTTAGQQSLKLIAGFEKGKEAGETSYFKSLDQMFTLRRGFLYCFTGWPSSGKSEFITQLSVLQAFFKKRNIAFYSPESYPVDEFMDMLIHCYLGKSTDRKYPNVCSLDEYKAAIEWVDQHFFVCDWPDTPDPDKLIQAFDFLHKQKKCEIFVVDPFNSLTTDGEGLNIAVSLKKNLTAFKRFAQQNKVMVWLVEHPKTPRESSEFNTIPGPYHLFGGTMWWNKVDVLATVHRNNRNDRHDSSLTFKTWKIKKQELNGTPGEATLEFDIRTKRYYEDTYRLSHPMNTQRNIDSMYEEKDRPPF